MRLRPIQPCGSGTRTDCRTIALWVALGSLALGWGCSDGGPGTETRADTEPAFAGLSLDQGMQVLGNTWMAQTAAHPDGVTALLDAAGGEGWLHLFHGDLAAAEQAFQRAQPSQNPASKAGARVGLARVHLDRAAALRAGLHLHRAAALALTRYRRDHRDAVRRGPYDEPLALLSAVAGGVTGDELAAFRAAAEAAHGTGGTTSGDGGVLEGLQALTEDRLGPQTTGTGPAAGLPDRYRTRLEFNQHIAAGRLEAAQTLVPDLQVTAPDLVDPLGRDDEVELEFESRYYDSELLRGLVRLHLAQAWVLAATVDGPGELIQQAVEAAWSGPVPEAIVAASLPPSPPQPDWLALFLSPSLDRLDWQAYWEDADGAKSFLHRLNDQAPGVPWTGSNDSESVDKLIQATPQLEDFLREALVQGVGSEGASMVKDLGFTHLAIDRIIRSRMAGLHRQGAAVQAVRLGERSVDPNPGRLGGPPDAARSRVSFRNDRAFLITLAHCLWQAGQAGAALDYLHPLRDDEPALAGAAYYLGQLDAASTIRKGGKANPL